MVAVIWCFPFAMNYIVMILITANRLFGAAWPITYRVYVTRRNVVVTITCLWALSVAVSCR